MLTMCAWNNPYNKEQALTLDRKLSNLKVNSRINYLNSFLGENKENKIVSLTGNLIDKIFDEGNTDILALPLSHVSHEPSEQYVIAGLSDRTDPSYELYIKPSALEKTEDFSIKKKASILVESESARIQLLDFRPDLKVVLEKNISQLKSLLQSDKFHAAILPKFQTVEKDENLNSLNRIHLNPREFIPRPGAGVTAYICRKNNIELRKLIADVHNHKTSVITNVERKVLSLLLENTDTLSIFCENPHDKLFRVYASYQRKSLDIVRATQSYSTVAGLAENIVNSLKKQTA